MTNRQTTTKSKKLGIWQTQFPFKYFQSVVDNSVKSLQMWMANCICFVLVTLNISGRAAVHVVRKL